MTAKAFNVPLVFAKKEVPSTIDDFYSAEVYSFTKKKQNKVIVNKKMLKRNENVLIIDDFLANGAASNGLIEILN
eukprot:CAMPEP_0117028862 /NCGR_PEP_ID=MMETSP0472-20121206/20952_1 /TAXON_ID=693140 ORGANISM="Tiarina fusus, Strain LIS" /NCGR_SAMPLE_ID=MMETSP0472 /ASSEMBLY_ACC=CAM_ASM_000603 /LENGTH=74 /DNA_ID=CAMNT_0004736475 /DNA_START=277 /DNA_END=501 /DNA_ORIENTATION=+